MVQDIRVPVNTVTSTVAAARKAGRILLPISIVAAITGGGLLVFFALISMLLL